MSLWDDEAGYDRTDPKHPDYAEAMFDRADMERKRMKENGPEWFVDDMKEFARRPFSEEEE